MTQKESKEEKLWRFSRNINAAGALAIAGFAAIIPGPNVLLASWAGLNAVQAGGSELLRDNAKKRHRNKSVKNP